MLPTITSYRTGLPLLLVTVFSLFIFSLSAQTQAGNQYRLQVGDTPPNYLGVDTDGKEVFITDSKGKIVVISFWASWCSYCLKELPILENIQDQVGEDLIKVVAINSKESKSKYRKIKRSLKHVSMTMTHDKKGKIGDEFGVSAIPHLFIIGKDGKLAYQARGYGESELDRIIAILNRELTQP